MSLNSCGQWVKHLSETELPVLAYTLRSICTLTADRGTHINKLSEAILQDPDLTSNVIKLANSACYNPGNTSISTISRAVMVIGFDTVKSIAVAATLVNKLTQGNQREQLYRCLVRSLHAALQAKELAASHSATEQEEAFIAALLCDVGEAAFWASNHNLVSQFSDAVANGAPNTCEYQQQELGASFNQIGRGLIRLWNLGPLIEDSMNKPSSELARIVQTANSIAKVAESGWEPNKLASLVRKSVKCSHKDPKKLQQSLKVSALKAVEIAEKLGIKHAKQYIFGTPKSVMSVHQNENYDLQIKALQKLSSQIMSSAPIQDILKSLINGIHQGVGMERVGLFLSKTTANTLYLSSAKGRDSQFWQAGQSIEHPSQHIIKLLKKRNCQIIDTLNIDKELLRHESNTAPFKRLIPAMIAPIDDRHPEKGFIYADRLNQYAISNQQFDSFKLFMFQVQLYIKQTTLAA